VAILGLTFLEREKRIYLENPGVQPDLENEEYVIGRILKPEARKDIIEFFKTANIVPTSMMDVSDGLSSEILHLCKNSNVGCVLYEDKIPITEQTKNAAYKFTLDPTLSALSGGEDYELVFTIKQADYEKIKDAEAAITPIGYITEASEGKHIITKGGNKHELIAQGWKSF
jgi:thiamine-monophosphate kinase